MDAIEQSCIDVCYHMKGGLTLNEAWSISHMQRNKIITYVNKIYKDQAEAASGKKHM